MSGHFKGVQTIVRKNQPAALYVYWSAHSLNVAHSCNVQQIRNCIGTIISVGNVIKTSAMHTYIFIVKIKINNIIPNTKWTELTFNVILGGL